MKKLLGGRVSFFIVAAAIACALVVLNLPFVPASGWSGHDSEWYLKMAEGRTGEVIQPFAGRFLFPAVAHWLDTHLFHDVTSAFLSLSIISLLAFLLINAAMLRKTLRHPLLLVPLFFLPYLLLTLREFFLPDVFYVFLIALFFLSLYLEREGAGLVVLFTLFLARRETTALLGFILAMVSWLRSRKPFAVVALIVIAVSLYTSGAVGSVGAPNIHGLSTPVYTVFKLSYNLLANVLGIRLWVNSYDFCEPVSTISLPSLSLLGNIREVGLCGFDASFPLATALTLLSVFGIMPLLVWYALFRGRRFREVVRGLPFWLLVALAYGIVQYVIGVPAGTGVMRIVGYGWPAFLLAAPFLMEKYIKMDRRCIVKLSLVQLFVAWAPFIVQTMGGPGGTPMIISLLLILPAYRYAFHLLRAQRVAVV